MISHVIPWDWIWWMEMSWATRPGSFDERRKRFETPGRGAPSCDPIRGAKRIHFGVFFFFLKDVSHSDWLERFRILDCYLIWLHIEWYSWRVFGSKLFLDQSYSLDISKSTVFFIIHIWYIQILYDIIYDIKFADFADLNGPFLQGLDWEKDGLGPEKSGAKV